MRRIIDANSLHEMNIKLCKALESHIGSPDVVEDTIVYGVSRGGLIAAVYVSHYFNDMDIDTISLRSYKNEAKEAIQVIKPLPSIVQVKKYERVIIVEDIVATGTTMEYIVEYFKDMRKHNKIKLEIVTAALAKSEDAKVEIDCYALSHNNEWIEYPYERNDR